MGLGGRWEAEQRSGFGSMALLWDVLTLVDLGRTLMGWSLEWYLNQVTRGPGNLGSGSSVMLRMGRGDASSHDVHWFCWGPHTLWLVFFEKALGT